MTEVTLATPSSGLRGHLLIMQAGLRRHGIEPLIVPRPGVASTKIVICWSWHTGRIYSKRGHRVLVMERAYLGDRFSWTSLGWDGLNGKGRFLIVDDGGARWRKYHDGTLLSKCGIRSRPLVTVMGQKPGDASLRTFPGDGWYRSIAQYFEGPVEFRKHPLQGHRPDWQTNLPESQGSLEDALRKSWMVIAWNSNSLVDAVLAGCHVWAGNSGAMAWNVADYQGPTGLLHPTHDIHREKWAHEMAWTQWLPEEIEDGTAWAHVREAMGAPVFSRTTPGLPQDQ